MTGSASAASSSGTRTLKGLVTDVLIGDVVKDDFDVLLPLKDEVVASS
jgi:hypothetical protein